MTAKCYHHRISVECPICEQGAMDINAAALDAEIERRGNAAKAALLGPDTKWERTGKRISLHGLGFLQVEFTPTMRLHVWHPDLPRRSCFQHSQVHDHRFGFDSTVLVGTQINHVYSFVERGEHATSSAFYQRYSHDGSRAETGNRPWIPEGNPIDLIHHDSEFVKVGETYHMRPYIFHKTEAAYGGKVATLMTKTSEYDDPATSTCRVGFDPDVDFNRFQMGVHEMWEVVSDVLGSSGISAPGPQA